MSATKLPAKDRVLTFLSKPNGVNTLTAEQITARFGVANPASLVSRLRKEGYAIYRNEKTRRDGTKVGFYRLGTHSAKMLSELAERGIQPRTV